MKKFTIAALIVGSFIIYSLLYHYTDPIASLPNNSRNTSAVSSHTGVVLATPTAPAGASPDIPGATNTLDMPTPASAPSAVYKDGSFTGSVADAQWGYIQVNAIIKDAKIADVQFLQSPNDRNRSIQINSYADPQLTSEAIQAQSANVDIVTGATDSSEAFMQSLSDALNKAKTT
jgi:uncharacterized protein with FMN-binding domain